ncbi:MAG: hypothetical protein REI94_08830 [Moraxellaceae bacterium]|nr:hypothetical protein [Moraxellaceae bacterium]
MRHTPQLRELERAEHRVLAGLRCVDATTGAVVGSGLQLSAPGARLVRNLSGLWVVHSVSAPASLAAHAESFNAAPASPATGSEDLIITVRDASGRYLSRIASVALPRDPDPDNADAEDSLFRPVDIPLYPASHAALVANWAELRISLRANGNNDALGGALVRVVSEGDVLARGLTDWRGEALVPVAGIPVTTWSTQPGAVTVNEIDATIEVYFDPASGLRTPAVQVLAGRAPAALPLVNPTDIESARAGLPQVSQAITLAAGRPLHVNLGIALP